MQQIERYGVIALLLVLVTVLGVTMWSTGEDDADSPRRLAAESQKQPVSQLANPPAKTPERVGPALRNAKRPVTSPGQKRGGERVSPIGLANGTAPKSGDLPPVGAIPTPSGSSLAAAPVAGTPSDQAQVEADVIERERMARAREYERASKRTNRSRKNNVEPAGRSVAYVTTPGGKPARDPNKTTDKPGKPREDYLAKQREREASTPTVSNFVTPESPSAPQTRGSAREYTVRPGDTLSDIASRELGSAKLWPQIERANPKVNPKRLLVGTKILLPNLERTHSSAAVAALDAGALTYTVQRGDVLSIISQRVLGTSKRWTEICDLNPKIDPDRLLVGTVLVLPPGASTSSPVPAAASNEPRVAVSTPRRGKKGVVR